MSRASLEKVSETKAVSEKQLFGGSTDGHASQGDLEKEAATPLFWTAQTSHHMQIASASASANQNTKEPKRPLFSSLETETTHRQSPLL